MGFDLADPGKRKAFMQAAIGQGVIIDWYLFKPATFRIAPPLTITPEEIGESCDKILSALDKCQS